MKEALIRLHGNAGTGAEDVIDFTSVGKIDIIKNLITVEYAESELSGMEGSVSKIIISDDTVTLNRVGEWVSTMLFIEGKETPADVSTPYGLIKLNIFTDTVKLNIEDNQINLQLDYNFLLGGERIINHLILDCHAI